MGIVKIAISNIKKGKNEVISFGILIIIASLLLSIGINLLFRVGSFYDEKAREYNIPQYLVVVGNNNYKDEYFDLLKNDSRVKETELEDVVYMENATCIYNNSDIDFGALFLNADNSKRSMFPLKVDSGNSKNSGIYLPMCLKGDNCKVGDEYEVTYKKVQYKFKIAGFFEAPIMGNINCGALRFYLTDDLYKKLYEDVGSSKCISVILNDESDSHDLQKDFKNETDININTGGVSNSNYELNVEEAKFTTIMMPILAGFVVILFSVLIEIVVLIVIKFRVGNNINNNMANIGALGAVGYTSRQIILSIVLEYLFIGIGTSILGVGLSYFVMNFISSILTKLMGMVWSISFSIVYSIISILLVISFISLIAFVKARRIKKLPPVVAFRDGMVTHNFKANRFPLNSSFGSTSLKLGLKYIFSNIKQSLMIFIIIVGVTITCITSITLYNNFSNNNEALCKMIGYETADLSLHLTNHTDYSEMIDDLQSMDEVRKAFACQTKTLKIEDRDVCTFVSDDFSKFEMMDFYNGKYPEYDNEIVISEHLAEKINKSVGDEIEVGLNGVYKKFIICGFTQSMNNGGNVAALTIDGIRNLSEFFEINSISVYLKQGENLDEFSNKLMSTYGSSFNENVSNSAIKEKIDEKISNLLTMYSVDSVQYSFMVEGKIISGSSSVHKIDKIINDQKLLAAQVSNISIVLKILAEVILAVTFIIVAMILYLVIKAMIIKRRKEFAIYKSIGYTDKQIMNQISLGLMPVITLGVISGFIAGCIGTSRFLAKALSKVGASHASISINMFYIIPVCITIVVFSYVISIFIARKIKNISVYELFTE